MENMMGTTGQERCQPEGRKNIVGGGMKRKSVWKKC
jgi:hypothetical protein